MESTIDPLLRLLDESNVPHVLIGGHAVNARLEPRFTADVDITVQAGPAEVHRLGNLLAARGYRATREHGAALPSGPDFLRFVSEDGALILEVQTASSRRPLVWRVATGGVVVTAG